MNEIMMVDIYQIRSSYSLDEICLKSLYQLYQPIVGHQAITLYLTMWSELSWLTLTKSPALISRLTKLADLSIQSLNQQVCKLEAIGLMNTYVRTNPGRRYLFDLKYPLTPEHFFQHQVLNSLLKQKLGQEDYQKTYMNFRTFDVNKEEYQEITHSFSDVFDVYLGKEEGLIDKNVYSKKVNHIEDEYDLTLFYQGLENLQISKKMINQNDEVLIKQLGMMYRINALDMQTLVKEAMDDDKLNQQVLKQKCQEYYDLKIPEKYQEIYHRQPISKMSSTGSSSIDQHIHYLESITPYQLLKDKQGGKEPLKRDLTIVESILTSLQLEPGVINALIELTLSQCDNMLSRNFMEAQGSRWKRKHIETVKDAIQEGKEYIHYRKELKSHSDGFYVDNEDEVKEDDTNISHEVDEDVLKMLSQFD